MRRFLVLVVVAAGLGSAPAHALMPNDPAWREQWADRLIRLPQAWDITTGDPNIVIATIDTGANDDLPDLRGALVPGWDFVENDAVAQDTQGHGTQVASVIAARGNNGVGMAGVCWRCRVMPVRVSGDGGGANPERVAAGVIWAVDHGARVINISVTRAGAPDSNEYEAIRYAISRGVLVVASAGNAGNERPVYPAAYPGVLAVAGTDDFDGLYFWSNRGPWVSLSAPGCHMVLDAGVGAGTICGTSFTPATVSGVAGLLLSRNPSLTIYEVAGALMSSAKPIPGIVSGRVDAYGALATLGFASPTPPAPPPPAPPRVTNPGSSVGGNRRRPAQRFVREVWLETDAFRRILRIPIRVGRGRVDVQLSIANAGECVMSLRSPRELVVALPAVKNLLSLSRTVTAGRYTLGVSCVSNRRRPYTLAVTAMFPTG